jgi:MYXO-CTERM domain-containing protein
MVARTLSIGLALAAMNWSPRPLAAANYDETVQGDLSGAPAAPTAWVLAPGANVLSGRAGRNAQAGTEDYDLTAISILPGQQLDSVIVTSYKNQNEFAIAFFALQAGSPWMDALGSDVGGEHLMGYSHLESSMTGIDLLPEFQSHASDPVFAVPLASGVYTMLIQDIDTTFDYALTFNVSSVPEPASASLAVLGLAVAARRRQGRER